MGRPDVRLDVLVRAEPIDEPVPFDCPDHGYGCWAQTFVLTYQMNGRETPMVLDVVRGEEHL